MGLVMMSIVSHLSMATTWMSESIWLTQSIREDFDGHTLAPCNLTKQCRNPRECYKEHTKLLCEPEDYGECVCQEIVLRPCDSSKDCQSGDRCKRYVEKEENTTCVSCSYENGDRFEDVDSGDSCSVCVAVKHLHDVHRSKRVFSSDVRANVLCDDNGSCATPGHIVLFNNQPMMMRSYCSLIPSSCVKRVMYVNSPKMTSNLKIESETTGLYFSVYAARFETKFEERFLAALLHAGL